MTMWLKTWEGVTSGTLGGRDDGYPETKYRVYDSLEELVRNMGTQHDEHYYSLQPANMMILNAKRAEVAKADAEKKAQFERDRKEREYQRLRKELGHDD